MAQIVLVVHIMIAAALVGVILLQRSEGGGLGLGSGTMGGLMTGRATANLLTRTTAILAACFFGTSIILAILSGNTGRAPSVLDAPPPAPSAPAVPTPPVAR